MNKYLEMNRDELCERTADIKSKLGRELIILGHYYQRDEVIEFADYEGDSYSLAEAGAKTDARWIVFCGVHFMAEASVILKKPHQHVFLPDMAAGCPLADMAAIEDVEKAWRMLETLRVADEFVPIVYMNSSAALKAFCGKRGGLVCTSSSAGRAFKWAFEKGKRVLFFPDENLGRNTAYSQGVSPSDIVSLNPHEPNGGSDENSLKSARVIAWNGYCHVHTLFTAQHVEDARKKYSGCKVIVHPECDPEVVGIADGRGSTSYLKKYAEDAPAGSTVVIGTEINLVSRLARKFKDKKIVPLARSLCPNMFKTSLADLCYTLEEIGKVNEVFVPDEIAGDARVALERMLNPHFSQTIYCGSG